MAVITNSLYKLLEDTYNPEYIKQISNLITPDPYLPVPEAACSSCDGPGRDCIDCFGSGIHPMPMTEFHGRP